MNDYKQLPLPFPLEYIEIPLNKTGKNQGRYVVFISYEDRDLTVFGWHYHGYGYASAEINGNRKLIHRIIMSRKLGRELSEVEKVDHINGNGLDNRRENLRLATHAQNMQNRIIHHNNKSGLKGVYKQGNKWRAQIRVGGVKINLGYFDTPDEAHAAYCEAADKYHGAFANFGK